MKATNHPQTTANILTGTDPSALTTQQLWREISSLKELLTFRIEAIAAAVKLAHDDFVRFPTDIDKAVAQLQKVHDEKFKAMELSLQGEHNLKEEKFNKVEQRFQLIETTRIEQKAEAISALNTALQAAKEVINEQSKNTIAAAAKSELAFTKQIDQQGELIRTIQKTLDDKITDIKDRQIKGESLKQGGKDLWIIIVAIVGVFGTILGIVAYFNKA